VCEFEPGDDVSRWEGALGWSERPLALAEGFVFMRTFVSLCPWGGGAGSCGSEIEYSMNGRCQRQCQAGQTIMAT